MLQTSHTQANWKSRSDISGVLNAMLHSAHQERKLDTTPTQLSDVHPEAAHIQPGMGKGTEIPTNKDKNKN